MAITQSLTDLVQCLSDTDETAARRGVRELMGSMPMLALPERWIDNSSYTLSGHSVIPEWLINSCSSWSPDNEFIKLCTDHVQSLDEMRLELFFTRFAALLGATRLFTAALREKGLEKLATKFVLRLTHTRMRQFPEQVCFSPTLRCQLECPYCISAGTSENASQEPDRTGVDMLLEWLTRQKIERLGLSGGEPTLSPLFTYILEETDKRGISLYMASNGMFSENICDLIIQRSVSSITLHLTTETVSSQEKRKIFTSNAKRLILAGINAALRCNLTAADTDPALFADHAHETGIREVRVAVPTPNAQHENEYIEPEDLQDFARQLVRLHECCNRYRIALNLAKPFPLCLLPESTARYFLSNGSAAINCPMHQNNFSNNIVVHPDFSFLPCLGLSLKQKGPIMDFANLQQAAQSYSEHIMPLIRKPLFKHCPECPLWKGSRCIGGCLSYRLAGPAMQEEKA